MDYSKIQEQIEAVKAAQVKAELDLVAAANARLEAARVENEKRRIAAEQSYTDAVARKQKQLKEAAAAAEEVKRAEEAKTRAEEHKINLSMEARKREESEAAAMKQRLLDLQYQHEQAIKRLKDSFDMAASAELSSYQDSTEDEQVVKDGSVPKAVTDNVDGSKNPLHKHLLATNN